MAISYEVKTYPGLGRYLIPDDVGRRVVRVVPCKGQFGFIPMGDRITGELLKAFDKDKITFLTIDLGHEWMDNNWLTVDEFIAKTKGVTATILQNGGDYSFC